LIDLQAVRETPLERQQVAHDAEDIDVVGATTQDALEEIQLEIQLVLIGNASRRLAADRRLGPFVEVLALLRHWLSPAWSGWARKRAPSRRWTPPVRIRFDYNRYHEKCKGCRRPGGRTAGVSRLVQNPPAGLRRPFATPLVSLGHPCGEQQSKARSN